MSASDTPSMPTTQVERLREESDRVTGALSKTVADQIIRAESAERRCDAAMVALTEIIKEPQRAYAIAFRAIQECGK